MRLYDILSGAAVLEYHAPAGLDVKDVVNNSEKAGKNTVFAALKGERQDGMDHIKDALARGCAAVICDRKPDIGCPYVLVGNANEAYAFASSALRGDPQRRLRLSAVTGTNGKTTVTSMLYHVIEHIEGKGSCALIGGVKNRIGTNVYPSSMTTPDPAVFYGYLAEAADAGARYAVTEASSHALELRKLSPCRFEAGALTNLTEDHLDYHKTMDAYFDAKKKLVPLCKSFVSNGDDVYARTLDCLHFSLDGGDFTARITELSDRGISFDYRGYSAAHCRVPICGKFNVYNALTALSLSELLGFDAEDAARALSDFKGAEGRFTRYGLKNGATAIIDYAHTPDALENALTAARQLCRGRLICVFGCGGDRDRNKRHLMGGVSSRLADLTVITCDNSRSEDPESIIGDILRGVDKTSSYKVIYDRREAILYALGLSSEHDVILLAGKGHEDYEINRNGSRYFSEASIIREFNDGGQYYGDYDSGGSGGALRRQTQGRSGG